MLLIICALLYVESVINLKHYAVETIGPLIS